MIPEGAQPVARLLCSENTLFAHTPPDVTPTCVSRLATEPAASQPLSVMQGATL